MNSTGFLDKNGKEIKHGDIVRIYRGDKTSDNIVWWNTYKAGFYLKGINEVVLDKDMRLVINDKDFCRIYYEVIKKM